MIKTLASRYIIYILILIVFIWFHFYGYVGFINYSQIFNGIAYLVSFSLFIYCLNTYSFKNHKIPTLILLNVFISMIMSIMFWNTSTIDILKSYRMYYLILIFFFLYKIKANRIKVEHALFILGIIYCLCWLYQIIKVPELVFGMDRDDNLGSTEERGFYRFFIPTKEHIPFLVLFMYELYRRYKKKIYICLSVLFFIVVILHVTRQTIFFSFMSLCLFIIYFNRKKWIHLALASLFIVIIASIIIENIPTVSLLLEQTEEQASNAEDDIRLECIKFYVEKSSENPITLILGNGLSSEGELGKFTDYATDKGYYKSDIGFFGMLFDFGLFGIFVYLMLFIKILTCKVENRYIYMKFYMIYVYCSYLLSHTLTTNIFFNMCVIYILFSSNKDCIRNIQLNRKVVNISN